MMTPRERLFAALRGDATDEVPLWLLFPYHPTGYYVDVRSHAKLSRVFEASRDRAIMLDRRSFAVPIHTVEVEATSSSVTASGATVERRIVRFRQTTLVSEVSRGGGATSMKKLLDSDEALEAYLTLPLELDERRIHAALDRQLPGYLAEKEEFPQHYGSMMLDLGEPVNELYHQSRLDEYAVWSLTHDDAIVAHLESRLRQKEILYRYCLEHDLADVYFLVGSELASPPLVSRATFRRWVVPFARRLIELIHSYGKYVIQHYHGKIAAILPDFVTMAPDGLHTIEAPPVGDATMTDAFEATGNTITLIGNIQYDDFRALSREPFDTLVEALFDECKGKRFILSPTAGPYEEEITDQVVENYLSLIEATRGG